MLGQDAFFISINEEIRTHLSSKYDTFAFISKKPLNKINNLESQKYDTLLFIYSNGNEKAMLNTRLPATIWSTRTRR